MAHQGYRAGLAAAVLGLVAGCGSTVPAVRAGTATGGTAGGLTAPAASPAGPAPAAGSATSGQLPALGGGPAGSAAAPPASGGGSQHPAASGGGGASVSGGNAGAGPVSSPISLGFLYAVNDAAAPAGVNNGTTITPSRVVHAYVDSWNRSGGIGGRRILPVYAELHSYNDDYEQQIAAACSTFTEDHHVVAVLVMSQYYSEQLLSCLGRVGVLVMSGDFVSPDRQDAQRYPLLVTPMTQLGEDREASVVRHLAAAGFLSARNRVGVVVEGCPVDQRIYGNGLVPALRRGGVPLVSTFQAQCFQSIQDFGAQTSQMSSAVLQFRRDRVDRVMVVSAAAEANIVFAFSEVAENQGYRPGYALSTVAIPVALQLNAPAAQLENMRGVGWLPVLDSAVASQAPPTAGARTCLRRLAAEGIAPASATDRWTAYAPCDVLTLYDAMLRATSGNSDPRALLGVLPQVTHSYVAASTIGGAVGTVGGRVAPTTGRIFAYDARSTFHYVGAAFPL